MNRKEFVKAAGALVTVTIFGSGLSSCSEDEPVPELSQELIIDLSMEPFTALRDHGGWVLHPEENVMLVNWNGEIRAMTSVCTHSNCSRNWVFGGPEATCTCHGSKFNWDGSVLRGPASRDLVNFNVTNDGDTVTVS